MSMRYSSGFLVGNSSGIGGRLGEEGERDELGRLEADCGCFLEKKSLNFEGGLARGGERDWFFCCMGHGV